jgi:Zn-dependent protease
MSAWQFRADRTDAIPIAVHASWFVVFGFVSGLFALGVLPKQYPGWSPARYWTTALLTSALFFACVLLHELGHAWAARQYAVPIRKITLFLFGGVAELGRDSPSPRAEVQIALAGPAVSFLLGGVFLLIRAATHETPGIAVPTALLARLNLGLAVFNLLPGYPLDGGRVIRALVWRATADRWRATAIAALGGLSIALGLMAIGLALILYGTLGGLWLLVGGGLLCAAAAGSAAQATRHRAILHWRVERSKAFGHTTVRAR